jgi:general secretion pathway protein A
MYAESAFDQTLSPISVRYLHCAGLVAFMLAFPQDHHTIAMYTHFFKLTHSPFSIAPDPRFLFMSERHREALAHLLYGVNGDGGFVLLTGEIGAGKTTVCRCFLEQIPENCNVGYIFNPKLTVNELLKSICDEFRVTYPSNGSNPASIKGYVDALNAFLLLAHANGQHNVLIIDEAQSLSIEVLEQLRLLTNLETNERKLLQVILIGQPELRAILEKSELRQLAQRVIARYHLDSLSAGETERYVLHRLAVAGITAATPLPRTLMKTIHRLTQGVPRRINLLCDRALLGAYAEEKQTVDRRILGKAAREVFGDGEPAIMPVNRWQYATWGLIGGAALATAAALAISAYPNAPAAHTSAAPPAIPRAAKNAPLKPSALPAPASTTATAAATAPNPAPAPLSAYHTYNLNDAPDSGSADAGQAYRQLARLWGQSLPDGDSCQLAQQINLRCYQSNKGFAEIRQLDRPAILSLRDQSNHVYYAVLTGLTDTQAALMIGGTPYSVSLVALARHFPGGFSTLWKIPTGYREKIHLGDQGEDVDWLASRLAKLTGAAAPGAKQAFDQATIRKIREFQSTQGLEADGVVGPKTFMQLNHATDDTEPRLQRRLTVAHELPRK